MSDEYDVYEVGKLWIPDEARGIIKIVAVVDNTGCASVRFDDDYDLYIGRTSLTGLRNILTQTLEALDNNGNRTSQDNVLMFKNKRDEND